MGLKSFVRTRKKILLKVGIVIILLCCIWGLYSRYLAPTRVALINFPAYQASSIALANDSRMIQVDALKPEDASKLKKLRCCFIFWSRITFKRRTSRGYSDCRGERNRGVYFNIFFWGNYKS